jgi:hypothetical protein
MQPNMKRIPLPGSSLLQWHKLWTGILLLFPTVAWAVMPPWVYQEARDTAMFHVQVKILKVTGPPQTPGECLVTGEVIRIFRDTPGTLHSGTPLTFSVSCSKRGDQVVVGGTFWTDYDRLRQAKHLEVFLNKTDTGYEVALWQSHIIEAPTTRPTFPPTGSQRKPQ